MSLAYLPSPTRNVWQLGPIPIRAYALCVIAGVVLAIVMGERRWVARGGRPGTVPDVAVWAVPFGLIGARLYHVATDPELYFGPGRDPVDAFKVWDGGFRDLGAVALGGVGAWIGLRRRGGRFRLDRGRVFAVYVALYALGRAWIEYLRVDHANHFLGLRLNDWTSLIVFLLAVTYLVVRRPGRAGAGQAPQTEAAVTLPDRSSR
ncbi:MAG: prolipoprotein diacylglyceryl transferase family protein [Mycobacteriales bacterium]